MDPFWIAVGAAVGAAVAAAVAGIAAGWARKPEWTQHHPVAVVALVVGLGAVSGVLTVLAASGSGGTDGGTSAGPGGTTAAGPTTAPATTAVTSATAPAPTSDGPRSTTPRAPTTTTSPRSPVPAELVGSWGGGTEGSTANRSYTFGRNGDVLYRRGSDDVPGTVVVDGGTLTLYLEGLPPQEVRWSTEPYEISGVAFTYLYLDGFTYVRQD